MFLKVLLRSTWMGILALGAWGATGCGSDSPSRVKDPGDAGSDAAAPGKDGGDDGSDGEPDGGAGGSEACGGAVCESGGSFLEACCVDAEQGSCGLSLAPPGGQSFGCFEKDVPGVPSAGCLEVLSQFEMDGKDPNRFEAAFGTFQVNFAACCAPSGSCGVQTGDTGFGFSQLDLGLGCLDGSKLLATAMMAPITVANEENGLPVFPNTFCDPKDGSTTCVPARPLGATGPKVPPYLLNACPAVVQGGCIVDVEKFVPGCGVGASWQGDDRKDLTKICVGNVPATTFGCDPVSAESLKLFPPTVCGCGESAAYAGSGTFCLSYVAARQCGTKGG